MYITILFKFCLSVFDHFVGLVLKRLRNCGSKGRNGPQNLHSHFILIKPFVYISDMVTICSSEKSGI